MKKNSQKISVEQAAQQLAEGKMIILTDHEERENEGDLIGAVRHASPDMINFMARMARGLICCAMDQSICTKAGLVPLENNGPGAIHNTNFCTPIDLIEGCTTGISAFDRSRTLKRLVHPDCSPQDFARPGHIFPILEAVGGLDARQGHTEASIYLTRLGGMEGAAVICEMIDDDGHMARGERIYELAAEWGMGVLSVPEIIDYKKKTGKDPLKLPTNFGDFEFEFLKEDGEEHFAFFKNHTKSSPEQTPLVRIHSECLTGDLLASKLCDCGSQLKTALEQIEQEGAGHIIYLRQEGRGIGLRAKIEAYRLQKKGMNTSDANLHLGYPVDNRDYNLAAEYLLSKGIKAIRLITNNPKKIQAMEQNGITVERIPLIVPPNRENKDYLKTKFQHMGHLPA